MIRTQIYLPEELHTQLKLLAKNENTNLSSLIRQGARIILQKKAESKPKDIGKGFFGAIKTNQQTNALQEINDYYQNNAQ